MENLFECLILLLLIYYWSYIYIIPITREHNFFSEEGLKLVLLKIKVQQDEESINSLRIGLKINLVLFAPLWAAIFIIEGIFKEIKKRILIYTIRKLIKTIKKLI